ncbi:hypothetical protein BDZ45DRAFT_609365, partial [Acephala macrosclerotiorum]
MIVADLDDPPDFKALSYTWDAAERDLFGNPLLPSDNSTKYVSCNKILMPIGYNLFEALVHLKELELDCWIWIDALRINQSDKGEWSKRVRPLGDLYSSAEKLIIWLGP